MAITRISSQDARGTSTTTSVSATYPAATTSGNLLIASFYAVGTHSSNGVPAGWTEVTFQDISSAAQNSALFYRLSNGTETTVTFTNSASNQMRLHLYEYTGNAVPIVVTATNGANSGTTSVSTITSGNVSTVNPDDLIFASGATGGSSTAQSFSNGFNLRQVDASATRLFDADLITTVAGTYTTDASWTTALRAGITIAAFKSNSTLDSYVQTPTSSVVLYGGANIEAGFSLTVPYGASLSSLTIGLIRVGTPTGNLSLKLYQANGVAGNATLGALVSSTVIADVSTLGLSTTFGGSLSIAFAAGTTVRSGYYFFSIAYSGGDGGDYLLLETDTPVGANTNSYVISSTGITSYLTTDFRYALYGARYFSITHTIDSYLTRTVTPDIGMTNAVANGWGSNTLGVQYGGVGTYNTVSSSFTSVHAIDALLRATVQQTYTIDAFFRKQYTLAYTVDAVLRKQVDTTHFVDAVLRATISQSYTIDALVRSQISLTHAADALLRKTVDTTFTVDASLRTNTTMLQSHTIDALLRANVVLTYTIDVTLKQVPTLSFTADALLRASYQLNSTIDALLRSTRSATYTIDASLKQSFALSHLIDAYLRRTVTLQNNIDAVLAKRTVISHTVDASIKQPQYTSFTIDAVLFYRKPYTGYGTSVKPKTAYGVAIKPPTPYNKGQKPPTNYKERS